MKNKLVQICLVFILFLVPIAMLGQNKGGKHQYVVSGKVLDTNKEPIPGTSVYVKNSPGVGTITDIDGKFSIKVNAGATLVFQSLGMKTQEVLVTKDIKNLTVEMPFDSEQMDEVVVTGLVSQKKVSVTSAVSSLNMSEIATPATSLNNMIGGRLAGVITMQTSGEPGKNISNFWIRGISTFGANQGALVLVDGLEGKLSDIDPDDVESFSILKDAAATAVYGVRGANGVVLVTTKRGKEGKLNLQGRATFKVSRIKRLPQYLGSYDYALLANEARAMSGEDDLYTRLDLDLIKYGLDQDLFPNVNWLDEIMKKTSVQQNYFVSASGGGEIARYYLSVGFQNEGAAYRQEKSIFQKPVSFKRLTYRSNIDINLTKHTKVYFGLDGTISSTTSPGGLNTNTVWSAVRLLTPLAFPKEYADGTFPTFGRDDLASPYVMLNYFGYDDSDSQRNMATLKLEQTFEGWLKGLTLSAQVMQDLQGSTKEGRHIKPNLYRATGRTSTGELIKALRSYEQNLSWTGYNPTHWRKYYLEAKANYNRSFDNHNVGALLFYYMEDSKSTNDTGTIGSIPHRRQNISGRLSYGYNDCYFIDANFGYTGSIQFKKGERFGFFPSIALGWVPTAYPWVKKTFPWLSFFKLRGSYGLAGNDRIGGGRFPYMTFISNHAGTAWGYRGNGIQETQEGADNLKWEVAKKANFGIDGKLFKNKIEFTVDVFRDERDHIFQPRVTLPWFVGNVTTPMSNVGRMHSYGSDGNISYFQKINKDASFSLRANYTFSQNIIDYFEQNKLPYDYLSVTGKPYNILRGYIAEGLFQSKEDIALSPDQSAFGMIRPGDIKYRDVNGDGRINGDDRVPLSYSNQLPRMMYGFGGDFNYKKLTIGVLFKGSAKVEYYRAGLGNDAGWIPFYQGELGNVLKIANNPKNRWTPAWYSGTSATERQDVEFPRLAYGGNANNSQLSTFWKRNGSFLRFQELSIRYRLNNKPWLKKAGLSGVDFEFITNNIFTIDSVKYFDPEQASANGAAYPIPTTFTFQVYLKF